MKKQNKRPSPRQRALDYANDNYANALRRPASTVYKAWIAGYRARQRDAKKKEEAKRG